MSNEVATKKADAVATMEPATILQVIQNAAVNPDVDIEKMERLMAMHERLVAKQSEKAFNEALIAAQSEIRRIPTDSQNKQTQSRYASYASMDRILRPIYTNHGFALSFDTGSEPLEGCIRVLCYVSHREGHSKTYQCDMPADGKGAKGGDVMTKTHAAGSGMSYGQRYLLKLIFNVAFGDDEDDDDGNNAGGRNLVEEMLTYNECLRNNWWTIAEVKKFLAPLHGVEENQINVSAAREAYKELTEDEQRTLWRAPTKGGIFTTQERTWMKQPPDDAL